MKKFMKGCAITALVLAVLGGVLGIVGRTAAGSATISQVVEAVTGGRVHVGDGGNWGVTVGSGIFGNIFNGEVNYDIGDNSMFDKDYDILSGNIEKYSLGSNIQDLDIEVGGCSFETKTSTDGSLYVEVKKAKKFQGYVEDGTLYIKATIGSTKLWDNVSDCKITLYLPEDYSFDEVEISMGAGTMKFDGLTAREASLDVGAGQIKLKSVQAQELNASIGAGQITLEDMVVGKLEVEVGMGEFTAEGTLNGDADIECSMGNVQMELAGKEEDFNYRLEGAMGSVRLGENSYSGFAQERSIHNNADKSMDVECSMGNISIKFKK